MNSKSSHSETYANMISTIFWRSIDFMSKLHSEKINEKLSENK
jgi:hypothetical protein